MFGRLTVKVIGKLEGYTRKVATCACSCGAEKVVDLRMLKRGDTRSCGCLRKEELSQRRGAALIGQVYGRLKVIAAGTGKLVGTRQRFNKTWVCMCECGTEVTVTSNALTSGNTKSCGCYNTDRTKETRKSEATYDSLVARFRDKALRRKKEWALPTQHAIELLQQSCSYCGAPPKLRKRPANLPYNGLDRVDSSKGYVLGNVVSCCTTCNVMKSTLSQEELAQHIEKMYTFKRTGT